MVSTDTIEQASQVGKLDIWPHVTYGPSHITGQQVQQLFGLRREAPDAPVATQHQDGNIDAAEQVSEIVVQLPQFGIAVLELLVDSNQFLVGRLQLLFCGLQLFVGRL